MSAIRGRDTKPETILRRALHAAGLRYRLNDRSLPGKPDLVFPRHRVVVLVHGCFWHGHDCRFFVVPKTRTDFWLGKIAANQIRDWRNHALLREAGWRVGTVWECAMRGRESPGVNRTAGDVRSFVLDDEIQEMHFRESGCCPGPGLPAAVNVAMNIPRTRPPDVS